MRKALMLGALLWAAPAYAAAQQHPAVVIADRLIERIGDGWCGVGGDEKRAMARPSHRQRNGTRDRRLPDASLPSDDEHGGKRRDQRSRNGERGHGSSAIGGDTAIGHRLAAADAWRHLAPRNRPSPNAGAPTVGAS